MASKRFAFCIPETLLPRLCRLLVQASSHLESTFFNQDFNTSQRKNKRYQTVDSTSAGTIAEVTTKLPKLLTKVLNPAMKITFPKIFSKYIQCSTNDQSG